MNGATLITVISVYLIFIISPLKGSSEDDDVAKHGHPHSLHHKEGGAEGDILNLEACEHEKHAPFIMPSGDEKDSPGSTTVEEIRINKYYASHRDRFYIQNTGSAFHKASYSAVEFQLDEDNSLMADLPGSYPLTDEASDARIRGKGWEHEYVLAKGVFHWHLKNLTVRNADGTTVFNTNATAPPLEMELIHFAKKYESLEKAAKQADGVLVTGHLFELVGRDNPALEPIARSALSVAFPTEKFKQVHGPLDLKLLFPSELSYCEFTGLYPMNPCATNARFLVFRRPIFVSARQLKRFGSLRGEDGKKISEKHAHSSMESGQEPVARSSPSSKCRSETIYLTIVNQHELEANEGVRMQNFPGHVLELISIVYVAFVFSHFLAFRQ